MKPCTLLIRAPSVRRADRAEFVHHITGGITRQLFSPDIENLNDAPGIGRDTREINAIEDGTLQVVRRTEQRSRSMTNHARCRRINSALGNRLGMGFLGMGTSEWHRVERHPPMSELLFVMARIYWPFQHGDNQRF